MTEIPTASSGRPPYAPTSPRPESGVTAWKGWIVFAGIMLMVMGAFQAIEGLVAIFQDDYYAVSKNGLVVHVDYTAWGWVMLVIAVLNFAAGYGVLRGLTWGRIWAIGIAALSIIANLGFTSAYPVWVVMIVTLDVIIIFALCVHWDEMRRGEFS
ncbi:MAG: hypothetical protein ACJ74U_01060 [Jatrophihabitantaceae bacterium]